MKKIKIAVVFGGKSGEHEVSLVSGMSVFNALDKSKYDVTLIGIDKKGQWHLPDQQKLLLQKEAPREIQVNADRRLLAFAPTEKPSQSFFSLEQSTNGAKSPVFDVIIPILHGTFGEDGTIQGLFEILNIPYVGSGVLGSAVVMDKEIAKRILRDAGIPVVPFITARKSEFEKDASKIMASAEAKFGYPYFIKPANAGSSVGVYKIKSKKDALELFKDTFQYDMKVLIEKAVSARELEISILGNQYPRVSIIGEIIPRHEFYSYEAKYLDENGAELVIPAKNLTKIQEDQIKSYAIKAFEVLECAGMARADFFIDKQTGEVFLNELNTIPGFTQISMYPKMWEASGLPYSKLLDELIELALERHKAKSEIKTSYSA